MENNHLKPILRSNAQRHIVQFINVRFILIVNFTNWVLLTLVLSQLNRWRDYPCARRVIRVPCPPCGAGAQSPDQVVMPRGNHRTVSRLRRRAAPVRQQTCGPYSAACSGRAERAHSEIRRAADVELILTRVVECRPLERKRYFKEDRNTLKVLIMMF